MSTPERKKRRKTKTNKPSPVLLTTLPDDLLWNCFARVPRVHYWTLSIVCKRFQSLLASPELYQTRSLLGRTQSCLYVCLKFTKHPKRRWFTLCQKPTLTNDTRKKKKSSGYVLATVPIRPNIYNISGSIYSRQKKLSSSVSIFECGLAPSMRVKRINPQVNVVDGKIYVAGGCKGCNTSNWMEVFDPKTQTWEFVSCPFADTCDYESRSAVIDGEIYYMNGLENVSYKPKKRKMERNGIKWYDSKRGRRWRRLMGLKELPVFADYSHVKLADYGGKLAVFWDKYLPACGYDDKRIWCAVVGLERRNDREMWGMVEWADVVLTFRKSYEFVCALSATV